MAEPMALVASGEGYQNHVLRRLPIISTKGLGIQTYKDDGLGSQW